MFSCRPSHRYQVLPEVRSFKEALMICQVMNSSLALPTSADDNSHFYSELLSFEDVCQPSSVYKFYIGATDEAEEGVWLNVNTKKTIVYGNFKATHPRGGTNQNCAQVLPGGFWTDGQCTSQLCGTCRVESSEFLYLRGLCFTTEQEMKFRLDDYVNGRTMFRGFYHLIIVWEDDTRRWLLKNTENNVSIAWTSPQIRTTYPVGLHTWMLMDDLCGLSQGALIPLSLSPCPHHMFMCKSGFCLHQPLRCNFRFDCADGSDEDNCSVAVVDSSYRHHLPPRGPKDTLLLLTPTLTLTRIADVDDISMAVDLEFMVNPTWTDSRLTFSHLHPNTKNVVPQREVEQLWTPKYQLLNLEGGQYTLLDTTVVINTARQPQPPDFNSVKRGLTLF